MEKTKIHPLIILGLLISSASIALYAYQNFSNGETAYGTVFSLICVFLLGLVSYGLLRNRRMDNDENYES